jgi:hypothetical protein
MNMYLYCRLYFSNGEIAFVNIFNRIDLNNCLKNN